MKKSIGILGGMGPMATADLFQKITALTAASCDREHIRIYIDSNPAIPDRTAAILGGNAEECYRRLLADARELERCGCTALAIPCNTSHYFADRLQGALHIPAAGGDSGHRRHHSDRDLPAGVRGPGPGGSGACTGASAAGHVHYLR